MIACPYCIDFHTKRAKSLGNALEELVEEVFVKAAFEDGGAVTIYINLYNAIHEDVADELYARSNLYHLVELNILAPESFRGYKKFSGSYMKEGKLSRKFKEIIVVSVATATQYS